VGWICPECRRTFGRRNQSHECAPAMSLDEYFGTLPAWHRPIFDEVRTHLDEVGSVIVEAVDVGILFKRSRTFAELRPRRDRLVLSLLLSRRLAQHPRITKTWHGSGTRSAYFIDLRQPSDVDESVRDWLTEAYLASPER
jgi:hypothetical protein